MPGTARAGPESWCPTEPDLTYVADPGLDRVRVPEDLLLVGQILLVEHEVHRLSPGTGVNHGESL